MPYSTHSAPAAYILMCLALLLPAAAEARINLWDQPQQCWVVAIAKGDTLTARCGDSANYRQVKVRLGGIDAPEKAQAFGNASSNTSRTCVFSSKLSLKSVRWIAMGVRWLMLNAGGRMWARHKSMLAWHRFIPNTPKAIRGLGLCKSMRRQANAVCGLTKRP